MRERCLVRALAIKHRQDIRDNIQRIDSNSEGDDDASYGGVECEDVKGESDEEEKQRYMKQHRQKADDERDVPALYTDQPELTCERLVLGSPGYIASIGLTRMSMFGRRPGCTSLTRSHCLMSTAMSAADILRARLVYHRPLHQ